MSFKFDRDYNSTSESLGSNIRNPVISSQFLQYSDLSTHKLLYNYVNWFPTATVQIHRLREKPCCCRNITEKNWQITEQL